MPSVQAGANEHTMIAQGGTCGKLLSVALSFCSTTGSTALMLQQHFSVQLMSRKCCGMNSGCAKLAPWNARLHVSQSAHKKSSMRAKHPRDTAIGNIEARPATSGSAAISSRADLSKHTATQHAHNVCVNVFCKQFRLSPKRTCCGNLAQCTALKLSRNTRNIVAADLIHHSNHESVLTDVPSTCMLRF